MGRRASESSDLTTSNASDSFAHQHGVALQTLAPAAIAAPAPAPASASASAPPDAVSVSVPVPDSDSVAVPGIPVRSRPHSPVSSSCQNVFLFLSLLLCLFLLLHHPA
ncbi:uncharacterized protein TrAtP1_001474 [Trichoderma atroviride]|uniref:uncharacterized protein n=1 Tax=Hypocrea atroviridis TaxID=63577 RepID=UPI0033292137|nr:hypothetical protein TrAtP1_001474 [Trichoderma atroviride]